MKKVWKLSVKYWSKSLSYISITQSIITQSRRKMSKLYTWNHYQETTEDDVNLLEERVPNLNSWPMCIYVFHIPRINQCPQSVLITLSWVFAYPSNKMEKCPQDENWMLNRLLLNHGFYTECVTLSCLLYNHYHAFVQCVTCTGSQSGYRRKDVSVWNHQIYLGIEHTPITHNLQISINWIPVDEYSAKESIVQILVSMQLAALKAPLGKQ